MYPDLVGFGKVTDVADKDVVLIDDNVIFSGDKIMPEQIPQIIVKSDLTFTAIYTKNVFTIYYNSTDEITIVGVTKEKVKSSLSPKGTVVELNDQQKNLIWVSNQDVRLSSGITIKAGDIITTQQISQIVADKDIVLTAKYREDLETEIPNTGIKLDVVIIVIGVLLIGVGVVVIYLIAKKRNK